MSIINMKIILLLLGVSWILGFNFVSGKINGNEKAGLSLCDTDGCQCSGHNVHCYCHHQQVLKIGLHHKVEDASQPPADTKSLYVENCHHLELFGGLVNFMETLQNLTIRQCHAVVVHPKLFESRGSSADTGVVNTIQLSNIHNLKVMRYAFKDMQVTGQFYLGEVVMDSVVSMAFHLAFVKEFSVLASKFERISMFGIKIDECKEFNVLGMTHFNSLAAHAIKVKCDKFSLAYNWFGHLHDSSFDVEFGLCDIQGNTFYTLQGKPFLSLAPQFSIHNEISQMGLVFRENKFVSYPDLPFASLALPSFGNLPLSSSYIDIDSNQFVCDCHSIGWFLAYGKLNFNAVSLANVGKVTPRDDISFIKEVYQSAGSCIECYKETDCREARGRVNEFAMNAIKQTVHNGATCHGIAIENHDGDIINSDIPSSSTKSAQSNDVRNEKLVGDSESAERLTENLILNNEASMCCLVVKIRYLFIIYSVLSIILT